MRHIPTGIEAKSAKKCQHKNRREARLLLEKRVVNYFSEKHRIKNSNNKKELRGSGMRGDKIRTYREQDNIVINNKNVKKVKLKRILKGEINLLWD